MRKSRTKTPPGPPGRRQTWTGIGWVALGSALLLVALCACSGPVYKDEYAGQIGADIAPREQWRIDAAGNIGDVTKAIDGDRSTAAVSGGSYAGTSVTVSFGRLCVFNLIVIDHGPNEMGYAGTLEVATSVNGRHFIVRQTEPGTRKASFISLISPTKARYVRIRVVAEGPEPWSIAEIHFQ